ncbi:tripartite tricarboxylate transporter substrate binding protein [Alcaligenaceae bacterium]|nr:tripartite tricarboxylate transporter substrate binding protein [Alcaligenaceae bacterium]
MNIGFKLLVAAAFSVAALPASYASTDFPDKAVRIIVPYAAGGGADAAARLIGKRLGEVLAQPVVIENRAGAGGAIGAANVASAKPDGYTLLFDAASFTINPFIHKLSFKPADLKPLLQAVVMPDILVVASGSPYNTLEELLVDAKDPNSKVSYASYGVGSTAHMLGELLNIEAGVQMLHVPYRGGAPAIADLIGGQVSSYFASAASSLQLVQASRLKPLAVTSPQRMPELPDVPTVRELGLAALETMEWNGFFVPVDTPQAIQELLEKALREAVLSPEVQEGLKKMGLTPVARSSAEFQKVVETDMAKWEKVIKQANVTAQ